jgi:hypothetical protein
VQALAAEYDAAVAQADALAIQARRWAEALKQARASQRMQAQHFSSCSHEPCFQLRARLAPALVLSEGLPEAHDMVQSRAPPLAQNTLCEPSIPATQKSSLAA